MNMFHFRGRRSWKGVILGTAAVLVVSGIGFEGVYAAEDLSAVMEAEAVPEKREGNSPESMYILEDLAATQEQAAQNISEKEALKEQEAGEAVQSFAKGVRSFSARSREDTEVLLELEQAYETLSAEEQAQVSSKTLELLREAEVEMGAYNHTDNEVSVSGNLPWYVQFFAEPLSDEGKVDDSTWIVLPYEMELQDARNGEHYVLPEGEHVTVTMPVPDTALRGQFIIYHYKSDGSVETIVPKIDGNTMSFEASSFSLYTVAGSTVVAGIGITTEFNLPDEAGESEPSSDKASDEKGSTEEAEQKSESQKESESSKATSSTGKSGSTGTTSSTEKSGSTGTTSNTEKSVGSEATSSTEKSGSTGTISSTEKNESGGTASGTEKSGSVGTSSGSEKDGGTGTTIDTEKDDSIATNSGTEKNGSTEITSGTSQSVGGAEGESQNDRNSLDSSEENPGINSSPSDNISSGTEDASGISGMKSQMNTDGTPQTDPSVPLQASPAQTGDATEIVYLAVFGMAAFLILSGSVVMKKKSN